MPKSRPHREQKKLAWPLLARLYTKVGPVTGVGGSSRKMWILYKDSTFVVLSIQRNLKRWKTPKTVLKLT